MTTYLTQQDEGEIAEFISILQRENVTSYLEVGSKFGGSLWRIATALPAGSLVVSVDQPHGKGESKASLDDCIKRLVSVGYDASVIYADSTKPDTIEKVRQHAPFDACLIDANHTRPYVEADWGNYGSMARIVAFHDIGWLARPQPGKLPIDVPQVWNEIKGGYRYEEIKKCPRDNGIGVLWRS